MSPTEPRCPSCGALVSVDAEWCGQCFRRLPSVPTVESQPVVRSPAGGIAGEPTWTCPACRHANPIELSLCEICGTPFASLFAEPEPEVEVSPDAAFWWSLLIPGLGHWMAGRRGDAVARFVVFAWTFGTVLIIAVSRSGGGLGAVTSLVVLYVAAWGALAATSAVDARRIVLGQVPLVSTRTVLWSAVVLVGASVLLATLLALPALRGR